ncbi:MAG: UDP-N-acetylglucosamine 1-carboxyvinyltransferase [Acidobacteria bacterium RIFCSPLOWO2_02_FULL_61_28]|nr:MAG: UDP-N-acetylglucosamine 1-carboxyvinyltransferase [Acidobacteria bacterium RIFCSPLOWO2_02_FULL_61_28]
MDRFVIRGGVPLRGTVHISGAKNAALPCLAACLLTDEPVTLDNLPAVRDIKTTCHLLATLGVGLEDQGPAPGSAPSPVRRRLRVEAQKITSVEAPWELVRTMRASTLILGPLVARGGQARISMPGGCAIGARPIDLHLKGLEKLGAQISTEHGMVVARAGRLRGARIYFERITVTGTEDLMMAAVLADGETVLENAAREPEVEDLASLLTKMGARIEGAGTSTIRIQGVPRLGGAAHAVIPDRIEAGTFVIAAGITGGDLTIADCRAGHLLTVIEKCREVGLHIETPTPTSLRVSTDKPLQAADMTTEEYPGFATDMQAQYMALVTQAAGTSLLTETIFENRFLHALELARLGANIRVEGNRAVVRGPTPLSGAPMTASDLRASASLVLAGLAAQGETIVERVYHIDRGYEHIEEKLSALGADIRRVPA